LLFARVYDGDLEYKIFKIKNIPSLSGPDTVSSVRGNNSPNARSLKQIEAGKRLAIGINNRDKRRQREEGFDYSKLVEI
jgi:hypothetical protein